MPHDSNGAILQEGDEVMVRAMVKSIQATDDYCNATVDCVETMPPSNTVSSFCLNTKQLTLLKRASPPKVIDEPLVKPLVDPLPEPATEA